MQVPVPAPGRKVLVFEFLADETGVGTAEVEEIQAGHYVEIALAGAVEAASPFDGSQKDGSLGVAGRQADELALRQDAPGEIQGRLATDVLDHVAAKAGKGVAAFGFLLGKKNGKALANCRINDQEFIDVSADDHIVFPEEFGGLRRHYADALLVGNAHVSSNSGNDFDVAAVRA